MSLKINTNWISSEWNKSHMINTNDIIYTSTQRIIELWRWFSNSIAQNSLKVFWSIVQSMLGYQSDLPMMELGLLTTSSLC